MSAPQVAGVDPGQRHLNGPQTSGREYRGLSTPQHGMTCDENVAVPMRDGVTLLADVYRPTTPGRYPVLVAASPYPRQVQNVGAPLGFIEAGASDFFVPRGYVHVIANLRGTGGSGETFGFFDGQERRDVRDLVEWAGQQPWSDGAVGMVGISYFAMTQLEAAVERPPHLRAIFAPAASADLYEAAVHHGLLSSSFVTPFLAMLGVTAGLPDAVWRNPLVDAVRRVLMTGPIHKRFETMTGGGGNAGLSKLPHDPHPWDDLWRAVAVEHPLRDAWWDERNLLPLLPQVDVPVYLGCDWANVPLHLPSTFSTYAALTGSPRVQMTMLGEHGLAWPWESLHVEALAWFDQWLKGRDTGLDGPPVRYVIPGAEGWHSAPSWPVGGTTERALALCADGALRVDEGEPGSRTLLTLGAGLSRPDASPTDPPSVLTWTSDPLAEDLDVVGSLELALDAVSTAPDTAWLVFVQDVDGDGRVADVTAGYLRAGLRAVDEERSRPGSPVLPCRAFTAVPVGEPVHYRIPLVANARRFRRGHRIRVLITNDDQHPDAPAMLGFRHASVGTTALNTVRSSSRLILPVLAGAAP
ncbi:X-Pro dipeptidyl-peptidase [Gemmatimonadetes bacterium T265]|nr:X-Pro dipeptidyl-peptidase [Gemmatimonadetes bacterium T265]